jgi:hypothetical protein
MEAGWSGRLTPHRPRRLMRHRSRPVSAQHSPRFVCSIRFMVDRPALQGFSAVLRSLETARCGGGARRTVPGAPVQQREREARVKVPGGAHVCAPAGRCHGRAAAAPRRRRRLQRVRPHLRHRLPQQRARSLHNTAPSPARPAAASLAACCPPTTCNKPDEVRRRVVTGSAPHARLRSLGAARRALPRTQQLRETTFIGSVHVRCQPEARRCACKKRQVPISKDCGAPPPHGKRTASRSASARSSASSSAARCALPPRDAPHTGWRPVRAAPPAGADAGHSLCMRSTACTRSAAAAAASLPRRRMPCRGASACGPCPTLPPALQPAWMHRAAAQPESGPA